MIPRSRAMAASAILLAAATHGLALQDFGDQQTVQIEGGGSVETAALGASFQDFSAGTVAPEPARARQKTATPEGQIQQTKPKVQTAKTATPLTTRAAPTSQGTIAATVAQRPSQPEETRAEQPRAEPATKPATPPVQNPEPDEKPIAQPVAKSGNAERTRKKGSTTGEEAKGDAAAKKTTRTASAQGNAGASNYAGQLRRKILRARRKSVNIRGTVLVTFRIADSGALVAASIARSSGSKRLDQVALAQVRAAAPFPTPPARARREYTIEIVSK